MFTKNFWKQAAERAVKSGVQAVVGLGILDGANLLHVDWKLVGLTFVGGVVLSLASSVVTAGIGAKDDPSAVTKA